MKTILSILSIALATLALNASTQSYVYDDAGRLEKILYANGKGVAYTYDIRDNLTQITPITIPPAPTNVALFSNQNGTGGTLSWEYSENGLLRFQVQSSIRGSDEWVVEFNIDNGNARSADITYTFGEDRSYRIIVFSIDQNSVPSEPVTPPSQGKLVVTTLEDENNRVLGQGAGDSLRELLDVAINGEVIEFAPYLSNGTIILEYGELKVTKSIIIDGSSLPEHITIDADNESRIFSVSNAFDVTIKGLRLTKGRSEKGGAVRNTGAILTLDECEITGNIATLWGGGIANLSGGYLVVADTKISANISGQYGGGLANDEESTLEVELSSIFSNFSGAGGGIFNAGAGGGFFNEGASMIMDRSGIWGNSAQVDGGGIFSLGTDVLIENCTIAGNSSTEGFGGGVTNYDGGSMTIRHSTISHNTGKGMVNKATATLAIDNSIVANNFDLLNSPLDMEGDYTAVGANIVRTHSGSLLGGPVASQEDPLLGPLAFYGARSKNMPLEVGSPALDAGVLTANTPSSDQASAFRPNGIGPDLGSIESRLSSETNLEWLTISAGSLNPVFLSSVTSYTATVPNETTSVAFRPAKFQFGQTVEIRINGGAYAEVESKAASDNLPLVAGENTVEVKVTAQNGNSTKLYTVLVVRGKASAANTDLATLTTSTGSLSPSFDPATLSYNSVVSEGTTSTRVTARPANVDATMEVRVNYGSYVALISGVASSSLALDVGPNAIDIKVTAKDGATSTVHSLTVTRKAPATSNALLESLSASAGGFYPDFSPGVFVYNLEVSGDVTSTRVTVSTAQGSASTKARINGGSFTTISSDVASNQMSLSAGANLIEVEVTAPNGTSKQLYTIIVTRTIRTIDWISKSGDADSTKPSMSSDCRYIAFASRARNLVTGGTNGNEHIFVYDRIGDSMRLISKSDGGQQGDRNSSDPAISADGLFVVFQSEARNLVPGDENGNSDPSAGRDIFVYDILEESIERVSLRDNGGESNQASGNPSISGDGRFVAFESSANNLVSGYAVGNTNVYIHDRTENTIIGIPVPFADTLTNRDSLNPVISTDGAYVAFEFSVDRNDDNQDLNYGYTDIYLYGTGGTLDKKGGIIERITGTKIGVAADGSKSEAPSISADGRYIAFESNLEDIDFYDTNKAIDVFVYDRETGATRRVSANGATGGQLFKDSSNPSISGDGRFVAFESMASNLVDSDTNDAIDIFMTDLSSGEITLASVNGDGVQGNDYSYSPSLSYDARCMAFQSEASNMVSGDLNLSEDIFVVETQAAVPSSIANLASLTTNLGTLERSGNTFEAKVAESLELVILKPVVVDPGSQIRARTNFGPLATLPSDVDSTFVLQSGDNVIVIEVTSADGGTTQTYTLNIIRDVTLSDADLSSLTANVGSLSPAFDRGTLVYTTSVPTETTTLSINPTLTVANASVTVNGESVNSGSASNPIALNVGSNAILVIVTAVDGVTKKTYALAITRAADLSSIADLSNLATSAGSLTPSFESDTLEYAASVSAETTTVTINPTLTVADASVTVNGESVDSGSASNPIALNVGSNEILIIVTAVDGVTKKTYALAITRAADLSSIADLSNLTSSVGSLTPDFSSDTLAYAKSVPAETTTATVSPTLTVANASVTVNGESVNSGSASNPIALNVGSNEILVAVTAADGVTKKTYVLVITQAAERSININEILLISGSPMNLQVTWESEPETNYLIEQSSDLESWTTLSDNVPSGGSSTTVNIDLATPVVGKTFFRVSRM